MAELKIGDKAPGFSIKNQDEKQVSLNEFKGKWVVLYFYPKDNTPGCSTEAMEFTAKTGEFNELGGVIMGVSPDSCESHRKFIEKKELNLILLSDMDKDVLDKYGVWQMKKMYGREYQGVVRSTFLINPKGEIAFSWLKVKVKGHVDDVYEKLKELSRNQ